MMKYPEILLLFTSYNHLFHRGTARYAGEHGWHLCTDVIATGEIPHGWSGDGILTTLNQSAELLRFVRSANVPTVDLLVQRPKIALPRVVGDNKAIGRVAADHFLDRGFSHFAWYSDFLSHIGRLRLRGFIDGLAARNLSCHTLIWSPLSRPGRSGNWRNRRKWLARALSALPKPLAVLAFNDYDATTVMNVCSMENLRVPDEVAVLGVDNNELICDCLPTSLSSVNHDLERIGYEGAALLDRLMNGASPPGEPILIPPQGITDRQSTNILAVNDEQVRAALDFLHNNFHRSFGVEEMSEAIGTPRRTLERLFRRYLRRTVHEELMRLRLQHARELLARTHWPATRIARETGFCHPQHFSDVFRRAEGITPRAYRQKLKSKKAGGKAEGTEKSC